MVKQYRPVSFISAKGLKFGMKAQLLQTLRVSVIKQLEDSDHVLSFKVQGKQGQWLV